MNSRGRVGEEGLIEAARTPASTDTEALYSMALERGVMFRTSKYSGLGNVVKSNPPLTIKQDEVDRATEVIDSVLTGVWR